MNNLTMNSTSTNVTSSSTNVTVQSGAPPIPALLYRTQATITAQVIAFFILGIITVLGNLASIITFAKTRSLRKRSNYMIINLSVADFLVAIDIFISCYYFSKLPFLHHSTLQKALESVDAFTSSASLLCLTLIAVERFHAVVFPFRHTSLRMKHFFTMCIIPWLIAMVIVLIVIGMDFPTEGEELDIYSFIRYTILFVALAIIIIAYFVIWFKSPRMNPNNRAMRDKKLTVTLFIVTLTSMLTWLPIQCLALLLFFYSSLPLPHYNYFIALKFLQFCNSAINFFIYILRMREFKRGFLALFCCKREIGDQSQRMRSYNASMTTSVKEVTSTSTITLNLTKQKSYVLNSAVNVAADKLSAQQVEVINIK